MTPDIEAAMLEFDLDPDDPVDVARFTEDQKGCNCDLDYRCYNPDCRQRYNQEFEYYAKLFSNPAVRELYRPMYGYEGGIRYKIEDDRG